MMNPTSARNLSTRSSVSLLPEKRPNRSVGLVTRLAPVFVFAIGLSCSMLTLKPVSAQTGGQFRNNGFGQQYPNGGQLQPYNGARQPNFSATPSQPDFRVAAQPNAGPAGSAAPTNNSGIPAVGAATATDSIGPPAEAESSWIASFQVPEFFQKVISGGWLMLPLGICSLIVITLTLERLIALRRGRVIPKPFVSRFTECVEDGVLSYEEATELCKEFDCPVSEVFRAALRRWGRPMFEIEQAVVDAGDRVSDSLRKYLRVFHAISNVAPLIGLLGTVIGMIAAFEVISDPASIGRPELLASGISTALMTTAGGLIVAIPAYLSYMYFSSKSDRYLGEIEKLCQRVVDCISEEGLESSGTARSKKRKAA